MRDCLITPLSVGLLKPVPLRITRGHILVKDNHYTQSTHAQTALRISLMSDPKVEASYYINSSFAQWESGCHPVLESMA